MNIEIHTPDGQVFHRTDTGPVRIRDYADALQAQLPYPILAARVNHHSRRLMETIDEDCLLELLDLRSNEGNMIYQSSLIFLFVEAVHHVLGKEAAVFVHNSLSKGLYCTIRPAHADGAACKAMEARMRDLVRQGVQFEEIPASEEELLAFTTSHGRMDQARLLKRSTEHLRPHLDRLMQEEEVYFDYLLPDASYLYLFEVRRYKNGVLLRFPHPSNPAVIPPFQEQPILYSAFSEETRWDRIMGIHTAADLNAVMHKDEQARDLVLLSEALHEKKIAALAQEISDREKRIILIAGPSSSGKTSFAKRLCIQLRVLGFQPLYLGTDDYFLERDETPLLPNGKPDFESLRALELDLFNAQMNDLLAGKKVDIPVFDFIQGKKIYGQRVTSVAAHQPLVIEGLHCLNPQLTEQIPDEVKFRIYISPLTQLNIDAHNRIPTTDARMLRRLVRDAQFRNYDAVTTINTWEEVRQGEEAFIFPFSEAADAFFNSTCLYEPAALKRYAKPRLEAIDDSCREYAEARRLLRFLAFFDELPDDCIVPNNSILREFIGGSVLVH